VLKKNSGLDCHPMKAAADDLAAEGFITIERHYTIADDLM
jgi:hypothetical protein